MSKRRTKKKTPKNYTVDKSIIDKQYLLSLAEPYDKICSEIDSHIDSACELIAKLDPLHLLQRGFGEYAALTLGKTMEVEITDDDGIARRMIDYLQCLIVSTPPLEDEKIKLTTEIWEELKGHIEAIFMSMLAYFIAVTAKNKLSEDYDEERDEFLIKAQMAWCYVKGDRHLNYFPQHLGSLLQPHKQVFQELFNITPAQFVNELEQVQTSLTRGMFDSAIEVKETHKAFFARLDAESDDPEDGEDLTAFFQRKLDEYGFRTELDASLGKFVGLDLFDLSKTTNLPDKLLKELSLSCGEDNQFLEIEHFKGWPLALWPTWNKPFLHVDGRFYCFDMYGLSDNIYRSVQKLVCRLKPDYRAAWSKKQQVVSEEIPLQLFLRLLPDATVYRNVNYRWRTGKLKSLNWVECDGLIIYDDHLFVIEVKGGAFTYTPPATDAPAYISSIQSLLFKPVQQGQRFVDYLQSAGTVPIYDEQHQEIGKLSANSFRQITILAVTVDQLTHLAAKSTHLQAIEGGINQQNVWNVSIDDLRIYADILDNPLQFLHFVEQRVLANSSSLIRLDDELDHLGLYLSQNRYVQLADELVEDSKDKPDVIIWSFTGDIDKYYTHLMAEDPIPLPKQPIPELIDQMLGLLLEGKKPQRSLVASRLLDLSSETRENLVKATEQTLQITKESKRPRPYMLQGDVCISLYCHTSYTTNLDKPSLIDYAVTNLKIAEFQQGLLLELFYDQDMYLVDIDFSVVKLADHVTEDNRSRLIENVNRLSTQRLEARQSKGKIRRNERCPCGSGKKYKRCHGGNKPIVYD